jgi:hypothetical protein
MFTQLDVQVISKSSQNKETPSNFHKFWSEELCSKKNQKKKNFDVEHYNLMDPKFLASCVKHSKIV